jgi:hypothetical protein
MTWRINKFDDFLVHQAANPIDVPVTSDRHFQDGYWFGFYSESAYAFMGLRVHPNNNVMFGYAGVVSGGEQRGVRLSRALRPDTGDFSVGPLSVEVIEPLEVQRVVLRPNESGVEWDVTMTALGLWTEDRAQQYRHGVLLNDVLRYTGVCAPVGSITIDGERLDVEGWGAARDHSWGVRSTMGPRTALGGVLDEARDPRAIRLWVPFRCGEQVGFFHTHEDLDGNVLDFEGSIRLGDEEIVLAAVRHKFDYHRDTRIVRAGTYTLVADDGREFGYEFEVVGAGVHPQGFGYNQGWSDGEAPGVWRGAYAEESSRHDVSDPKAKPFAEHLPERRRLGATEFGARLKGPDGDGWAMVEHVVYGTYRPAGFEGRGD